MSIEAMAVSLHHSKTQGATKLVLLGIANHEGDGGAWPSISTLARYAGGVNRRTVQRCIQELINLGEITCEVNGGGQGDARPNLYRVTLRCPQNCDGSSAHRKIEGGGVDVAGGRSQCHPGGGAGVTGGAVPVSPEPSINHKENQYMPEEVQKAFEEFWNIYPRREGKRAALKAFLKALEDSDLDAVMAGARRFATDPNLPVIKQYIAHPATWLNQGRWEDDPLPVREMTPEERQEIAKRKAEADRVIAQAENARMRAESDAAKKAMEANPPKRCEHDRVLVMCNTCSPFFGKRAKQAE